MIRTKAALIHLILSILLVSTLFSIVYFIWYPKPFFELSGVIEPFKILVLIDVVIGPLLTFVVFKKGKKHLKLDLSIIAVLQLSAIIYGSYVIYNGRPSTLVFNNGQFHYLAEKFANNNELIYDELRPSLFSSPKYAFIHQFNQLEIYNGYAYFEPISNYDSMLKPYSFTVENMKAKFKGKISELNQLSQNYINEDIVFFNLNHKGSINYIVYSRNQNRIIDYLKF